MGIEDVQDETDKLDQIDAMIEEYEALIAGGMPEDEALDVIATKYPEEMDILSMLVGDGEAPTEDVELAEDAS